MKEVYKYRGYQIDKDRALINLDQLYARTPVTTFTGTEIVAVQKGVHLFSLH